MLLLFLAVQEIDKQIAEGRRENVKAALSVVAHALANARIKDSPGRRAVNKIMYDRAAARLERRGEVPPKCLILPGAPREAGEVPKDLQLCADIEHAKLPPRKIWSEEAVRVRFYKLCNKNSREWKRLRPRVVDAEAMERRLERYSKNYSPKG